MPKPIKLASIPAVAKALTFAENQPEYLQLPALMHVDRQTVMFCWQFTWRERLTLLLPASSGTWLCIAIQSFAATEHFYRAS
jgi:hypothetical protein